LLAYRLWIKIIGIVRIEIVQFKIESIRSGIGSEGEGDGGKVGGTKVKIKWGLYANRLFREGEIVIVSIECMIFSKL